MTRRILIALLLLVTCELSATEPPHVTVARSYIGTVEKGGNNRGPEVKLFLKSVGLDQGNPWCAAFVSFCLTESKATYPTKRTALARAFISKRSVRAKDVLLGRVDIAAGWLSIYGKGNTVFGHIEIVTAFSTKKRTGRSIGGNTSSGRQERDGDGVWEKAFSIQPGNYFRITHFEPVEYAAPVATVEVRRPVLTMTPLPLWKLWREPWS